MSSLERVWVGWLNSDVWRTYSKSAHMAKLRNSRGFERLDLARRYVLSRYHSTWNRSRYRHVRTVCLEIGHMKSGGTMLGALLDAHPRVAFADETDAVRYFAAGFRREQICYLLEKGARREAMKGRVTARRLEPYSFEIPGQWQGHRPGRCRRQQGWHHNTTAGSGPRPRVSNPAQTGGGRTQVLPRRA